MLAAVLPAAGQGQAAAGWPQRPYLAVDTVAHAGRGGAMVLTPDEKRAVSVSSDGTLRVWEVASGELLQRFYLPKTSNISPRLAALALSPDGQVAAVGGFDFRNQIALVSLQTGRVERVIAEDGDCAALAFARDGRYIASGRSRWPKVRGLRVYEAATGKEVFRDPDFAGELSAIRFRDDGTFFAISREARVVKLYKPQGAGFRLAAHTSPRWHSMRAVWDNAGKSILIGPGARLDGETLDPIPYELDQRGLPSGVVIARVQQAADGRFIGISGTQLGASQGGYEQGVVRHWKGDRRIDGYAEFRIPDARARDIAVTRDGAMVYLTDEGTMGLVGADGKLVWRNAADVANLDGKPGALKVTEAGLVMLPVHSEQGVRELAFDLAQPGFVPTARAGAGGWTAPRTISRAARVLAWENSTVGTVNDAPLPYLTSEERSISVAVHSSEPALVYGSDWQRLTKVSGQGKVLWRRFVGANVTAVNLIESRGLVVAATASGMLSLFRWSDGEPVAQYYLQPSARRWLLVSTDGYYEAGAGAEDIVGWVVNPAGQRVADFLPMSRFRGQLLLPGLGAKAWELGREADAVKALVAARPAHQAVPAPPPPQLPAPAPAPAPVASPAVAAAPSAPPPAPVEAVPMAVRLEQIPPRLEIVSPGFQVSTGERRLRIRLRVRTPEGAPVTQLRSMVASANVATRAIARDAREAVAEDSELLVELPPEDSEVRVIAENRFGASAPVVVRVSWTGARQQADKGNLYVLAAGISKYDNPEYDLGLAAKDARDFVATLRGQRGAQYNEVVVQELLDRQASKEQVERGFEWLREKMTARDTAIVFFAGHGYNDGASYYFITRDADLRHLPQTAVPFDRIRAALVSLPGRALIFVDTCHAGNVIGKAAQARDNTAAINHLASSENGLVVFASSTGAQESQENPAWGNGAFTKAVLEGLKGAADFKKRGRITYKGLDAYVSDRVDELTQGLQTPVTPVLQGVPDFAIAQVLRP